tara:strand:+ start:2317 stop:3471 length:1155 start_codon:yes stop_codon:yes gene_type:complete
MAITRLTDIITVFDSKWTYGDVKFGYEPDVNQDHDTKYPLMLVEPPISTIPEINNGREEYAFELNFYNLYSQAAQSAVTLQKRWDNLQDLAYEWLDMVLKNYQDTSVEVYLNDESIEIERVKDVANDRLVQIKITFTMSGFSKCFRPVSNYPSDFANLAVWLKADSGGTFPVGIKSKMSAWADQSGNGNNVAQSTEANKPEWVGYDGINDKAYINFNGTTDFFTSSGNSPITADFTIFIVSQVKTNDSVIFEYEKSGGIVQAGRIAVAPAAGVQKVSITDGTNSLVVSSTSETVINAPNITTVRKESKTATLQYDDASASTTGSSTNASFDATRTFNHAEFVIGKKSTNFMSGIYSELIIYNRALSNAEISDIKNYLNTKYKIY